MDISVIIPVYNEGKNIPILYKELVSVLSKLNKSYEIIFVDDGSTDSTLEILSRLSNIKVITFRRNFGQTAALDAGFKRAQGDIIITLDGDLQNDPKDIPRLIEKLSLGYDVIAGWRYKRNDGFSKKIISRGASFLRKLILRDTLKDSGCTLRAYKKECIKDLNLFGEMHRFIHIILKNRGFKIAQIKVNHRKRSYGKSKYNISRTLKGFLDMLLLRFWTDFSARPIHVFGTVGLFSSLVGFLFAIYLTYLKFFRGESIASRPLLILSVFMMIAGIIIFMFGLLADIMIKLYYKEQQNYSIKNESFNDKL